MSPIRRSVLTLSCTIALASMSAGYADVPAVSTTADSGTLQLAQVDEAADSKAKAKVAKQDRKKDKRVCKRQKVTGSRIAERVCRKQSDWDRIRDQARESVEYAKEKSSRSVGGDG